MAYEKNMNYAGFWKRLAATVLDWLILFILVTVLQSFIIPQSFIMNPEQLILDSNSRCSLK